MQNRIKHSALHIRTYAKHPYEHSAYRGYFKVKRDILGKLTGVQLRMYLFICKAVTKKNDMWNSFNDVKYHYCKKPNRYANKRMSKKKDSY